MNYGIDSAYPPSPASSIRIWTNGWRWSICYVGGPRAVNTWANADCARLAEIGFVFLPTYVGRTYPYDTPSVFTRQQGIADADEANVLTGACGFDSDTPLCLDAEYGDYQYAPGFKDYLDGWCERVHTAGHPTVLYSDTQTINALGTHVDYKWGADTGRRRLNYINPVTQSPPWGQFDPALPPPWDAWQFAFGSNFDVDSATDSFFGAMAHYTPPA